MRYRVLTGACLLIVQMSFDAGAQAPAAGALIAGGEEVMFVNGARLRCEAACRVVVLPEGAMRITFEPATQARVLSLQALIGPLRFTLAAGDLGLVYELGEGRSARFENGVQRDGTQAVLLETRSLAQIDEVPMGLDRPEVSSIVSRHPGRALRRHRELEVGAR